MICRNLSKEFVSQSGEVVALEQVSLEIKSQEFVSLVGPSGCGKTTLLRLLAGLIKPDGGEIDFGPTNEDGRPHSAMVFQEQGLFPWMNVIDNAAFGLEMQGVGKDARHEQVLAFLSNIGLAGFEHSYPHELSGGMRQRVALARAFLADPQVLLMDEPFGGLDAQTRLLLQEELLKIWQEQRKTVLFVTHDIDEAVLLSDRVLVMSGRPGRILEDIKIPMDRPRDLKARDNPHATEIKWHIWDLLEDDIRV